MRVEKLKNGKAAGKDEVSVEMIKDGGNRVVHWIWRLCNMAFVSGIVVENWRSSVIVTMYKGKERGLNVRTIDVLAAKCGWKNICRDLSR